MTTSHAPMQPHGPQAVVKAAMARAVLTGSHVPMQACGSQAVAKAAVAEPVMTGFGLFMCAFQRPRAARRPRPGLS